MLMRLYKHLAESLSEERRSRGSHEVRISVCTLTNTEPAENLLNQIHQIAMILRILRLTAKNTQVVFGDDGYIVFYPFLAPLFRATGGPGHSSNTEGARFEY